MNTRVNILSLACLGTFLMVAAMALQNNAFADSRDDAQLALADTTPPEILIATPKDGSTVSGRLVEVTFYSWDMGGLSKFELYIDGALRYTLSTTARELIFKWGTRKYTAGEHTLEIMAYDRSGNSTMSPAVTVYLVK